MIFGEIIHSVRAMNNCLFNRNNQKIQLTSLKYRRKTAFADSLVIRISQVLFARKILIFSLFSLCPPFSSLSKIDNVAIRINGILFN